MENAFRALLTSSAAVTAHVPATRINFGTHPQGAQFPGIVLNTIDDAEGMTFTGPDGLSQARVQVDCYGATYAEAKSLARTVRGDLNGFSGGQFQGVFLALSRDYHETGAADRPYRVSMDFLVKWSAL